jgi:hypothetical protein
MSPVRIRSDPEAFEKPPHPKIVRVGLVRMALVACFPVLHLVRGG